MINDIINIIESGKLSGFRGTPEGHNGGYWVQALEEAFKEYFKVKHAISMNSATACLHSAVVAASYNAGKFLTYVTPYSFSSSVSCVLMAQCTPKFGDIDEDTFNLLPIDRFFIISIPVHLMGHPCDLDEFMANFIIEDASQAIGAEYKSRKVGTIGDCGIFSFNQSKQISCGEGGMLITNNDYIARVCRAMRNHGEVSDPDLKIVGYNYRLGEIEARIVLEQFKHLDENLAYRNELAQYMTSRIIEIDGLIPPKVMPYCTKHAWYTYAVRYLRKDMHRNEFQREMMNRGIYFGAGYVTPIYHQPIYNIREPICPVAERMYKDELMVFDWLKTGKTKKDVDKAIDTAKAILK